MHERFGRNSGLGSVVEERQGAIDLTVVPALDGPVDTLGLGAAADMPPVATELTEAQGVSATAGAASEEGSTTSPPDDSPANSSIADEPVSDEKQSVPHLSKQALGALLDELTGELVALEDFDRDVDVEFYRRYWFGSHLEDSLLAIEDEHRRKGKCTFHVDGAGKLLDDPDKFLLAVKNGVAITLCVHKGKTEDENIAHILRPQFCNRVLTTEERRKLRNEWIEVQLRLGADYDLIAKMAGVCPQTVRNVETRAASDGISNSGFTKRPDGRFKPSTRKKIAEAGRLRAEGKDNPEIAAVFGEKVETVDKWFKDPPARGKTKDKKKHGKKPKTSRATSAAQPTDMTDTIAANEGIPKVLRPAFKFLDQDARAYFTWSKAASAKARADVEAAAGNVGELVPLYLYGIQLAADANWQLRQILNIPCEVTVKEPHPGNPCPDHGGCKVGDVLHGTVMEITSNEVSVALSDGSGAIGVIDNRENCVASKGELVQGQLVRVRVEGFDSDRDLTNLTLLGRQSFSHADCASAFEPRLDGLCSPDTELVGLEVGPQEKEVI